MATKTKSSRAVLAILTACALVAMLAMVACSSPKASSGEQSTTAEMSVNDTSKQSIDADAYNILVPGNDQWESTDPGHPDMICVMRVDFKNHKVTQVTVPRDTRVTKADGTPNKLMWEMTGKPYDQQIALVEGITGLKIDYYAEIGFPGLEKLVDGLGGVPMNLPYDCVYSFYTNDYPDDSFKAGQQVLNGFRAMEISRARTGYGDQGIQNEDMVRQFVCRQMFTSLMQLAYNGGVAGAEDVLRSYQGNVKTNIPLETQIAMAKKLGETGSIEVVGTSGPFIGDIAPGEDIWLVQPDTEGWAAMANAVMSGGDLNAAIEAFAQPEFTETTPGVFATTVKVG